MKLTRSALSIAQGIAAQPAALTLIIVPLINESADSELVKVHDNMKCEDWASTSAFIRQLNPQFVQYVVTTVELHMVVAYKEYPAVF